MGMEGKILSKRTFTEKRFCIVCSTDEQCKQVYRLISRFYQKNALSEATEIVVVSTGGLKNLFCVYWDKYVSYSFDFVQIYVSKDETTEKNLKLLKKHIQKSHGVEEALESILIKGENHLVEFLTVLEKKDFKRLNKALEEGDKKTLCSFFNNNFLEVEPMRLKKKPFNKLATS